MAMRLPLRWIAILYGQVPVDFAITSGVHTYEDVLKGLMAGANCDHGRLNCCAMASSASVRSSTK